MLYDEDGDRVIETLDGSEMWTEKSSDLHGNPEGTVYLNRRWMDDPETSAALKPDEAMALAAELTWAAGGETEPHIWEAYVTIRNPQGRFIYEQLSLHATKAGAEQAVEDQKKEYPVETSDPNFTLAARKLKIGA